MNQFGYIEATFSRKDLLTFASLVTDLCTRDDFYYSNVVDYIRGDVSSKLHITIFYGLINEDIHTYALRKDVRNITLKTLKLGKLFLVPGYKKMYKILCLEVLDKDNRLKHIHEHFKSYKFNQSVQHKKFMPHLTLAYVKPSFELKQHIRLFQKTIRVKQWRYSKQ